MDTDQRQAPELLPLPQAAISALQLGRKIEAIRIVRQQRGIGLKQAKDAVDAYVQTQPSLQQSYRDAESRANLVSRLILVIAIVVALLVWYVARR